MAEGWVKTHRSLSEHPMWLAEKFTRGQAWVDLIMLANHRPGTIRVRGIRIEVLRGQVGHSEVTLATRWHWSRDKVRRFMRELESDKMVLCKRDNKISIVTILNYEQYQEIVTADDTADKAANNTTNRQQTDTNKNEKNEKKERQYVSEDRDVSCSPSGATPARAKKRTPCPHVEIIAAYHELLPQLPVVQSFGLPAKKTLQARWNERPENQTVDFWRELFSSIAASDFLMGRAKDWQCPGLLWIIGPKNFAKILNGYYQNHGPSTGSTLTDANTRAAQAWLSEGVQ